MTMHRKLTDENYMKLKEVLSLLRISKSTWYAGISRGEFPQPVRIGTRTVLWKESDIEAYLQKNSGDSGEVGK
jgi:prophage regulatory protein